MSYHVLRIYVNEIALHATAPPPFLSSSGSSASMTSWHYSSTRTEMLIRCLQYVKEYMDRCLSLSSGEFDLLTLPEYARMFYATLVLGKFAIGCGAPSVDSEQLRQNSQILFYLDSLIDKMTSLSGYINVNGKVHLTCTYYMKILFQQCRNFYARIVDVPPTMDACIIGNTEICFTSLILSMEAICAGFNFKHEVEQWESWTELMAEWLSPSDTIRSLEAILQ